MISVRASKATFLAPGSTLDRYDLLLQVAEGGMGVLWLARQRGKHGFDRIVAIKTILPKLASDAGFQRMFLDEARVVSRIEHPNVAQVLDLGEERGVLFLVMEWIDGESLINLDREVARRTAEPIPVGILTRVMVDVCAGLHAAHELKDDDGVALGVVHRDVSPHNLLVGFRGTTKVIDFGIAKARNRMAQDTSIGLLKGKINYMAPEQAMGMPVDRRTDVWSAGASMYRFLAGSVPYSAPEPLAVLRRIAEGRPADPLPTTVPEPIRVVVEKALEVDARKRFETAHGLGAALEAAMRTADVYATREDVAAFLTKHLGEARAMHVRQIEHAVRSSRARMRAGLETTAIASEPELPSDVDELTWGARVSAESLDVSIDLERGSGESSRPSLDTVPVPPPHRSSGPSDATLTEIPPQPTAARLGAGIGGAIAEPAAAVPVPPSVSRRPPRPVAAWVAGTCLLAALLAGGFAWRASRPHPIGAAAVVASPTHVPESREPSALPPSETSAVQATARAGDPPSPASASAQPKAQRSSATALVEPSASDRGDNLLELARHARRAGRIGDAAALFAAAVEKAPADSEALTGLAEVSEAQGITAKATALYRRAVAVNPRYLPARLGLADSLWTSGQLDEARTAYRGIVDQFPSGLYPNVVRERADRAAAKERPPR
jgi:serine/threonine protein kinase/TolA-binding protein